MKKVDGVNYFNSEIKPLIEKLPEVDKNALLESLFVGMVKAANEYYDLVYGNLSSDYISNDMSKIKNMILSRIKYHEINNVPISLEGNPNDPTDRFFVFDAKADFDKLIRDIANIRK